MADINTAPGFAGDAPKVTVFDGGKAEDNFGISVAVFGDGSGDGRDDLIVGASGADAPLTQSFSPQRSASA